MPESTKAPRSAMEELVHSSLLRVENILLELSKTAESVEMSELKEEKKETSKDVSKKIVKTTTQKGAKKMIEKNESSKYMTNVLKPQVRSEYAKPPLVGPPKLITPKSKKMYSSDESDDFDWDSEVSQTPIRKAQQERDREELEKQVLKEREKQAQKDLEFQKKEQEKTRMELERATIQATTSSSVRSERNGIVVDVNLKVHNPNEERKMNMSIECHDFTPKRIYFDGKWREIRPAE